MTEPAAGEFWDKETIERDLPRLEQEILKTGGLTYIGDERIGWVATVLRWLWA